MIWALRANWLSTSSREPAGMLYCWLTLPACAASVPAGTAAMPRAVPSSAARMALPRVLLVAESKTG
ncbi:hypothetical protein D9M71_819610 [compost metagenome]